MRYPARARRISPYCSNRNEPVINFSNIPSETLFKLIKNAYRDFPKTEFRSEYIKELKHALEIRQKIENPE